jgi:subtilase family serine protease
MTNYHCAPLLSAHRKKSYTCALGVALAMGVALPALASAAELTTAPLDTSAQVGTPKAPKDLGRVVSAQEQTISVYLNLHDQAGFDQAVDALYDPASPTFHHWFADKDFAKYAPTAAEMQTVRAELERKGLTTVSVDPMNFSIRVSGSTNAIEAAFHTELHTLSYGKSVVQTPISEPKLAGAAGNLVDSTVGIERHQTRPQFAIATNLATGKPLFKKPVSTVQSGTGVFGDSITGTDLAAPQGFMFTTNDPAISSSYFGVVYNSGTAIPSYTPSQLQQHYGLKSLIKQGYDGTGQTIALVDGFGYAFAEADANLAANTFGLPILTSKNFRVIYPEGMPANPNDGDLTGWSTEIALDIQSAHAIAPGANIVLVASNGQDNADQIASLEYILTNHVANIVSCSWENDEEFAAGTPEEKAFNKVLERMAAAGIAVQFSSGDSGDNGLGTPLGAVGVPSNSPYVTAVGGTSVMTDPLGGPDIVTGWGTSIAELADTGTGPGTGDIFPPPSGLFGFQFGAGGGQSLYYAKPSWQKKLPGVGRQVPDVSALADPLTGYSIIATTNGEQDAIAGIGGTSLAAPLFSAIWAIAQQYNNETLGQAAPTIARLKPGQITDVVNTSDVEQQYNLIGTIHDDGVTTNYSSLDIFAGPFPPIPQTDYLVAIGQVGVGATTYAAFAFGADTSLTVGPGWDNVTGYGQPNGLPFIKAVGSKSQ